MRLPNIKMLLRWPSRMQIYDFVESHTFLEQFVSVGVRDHFSTMWYFQWIFRFTIFWSFTRDFLIWGYETIFLYGESIFWQPYGGTHNEAPKRKNAASLTL